MQTQFMTSWHFFQKSKLKKWYIEKNVKGSNKCKYMILNTYKWINSQVRSKIFRLDFKTSYMLFIA